jgi:hypothetical protein
MESQALAEIENFRRAAEGMVSGPIAVPLKFEKGKWYAKGGSGAFNTDMTDHRLLALPRHCQKGWTKWEDRRPVDRELVYYKDGTEPCSRDVLGDYDEGLWGLNPKGEPQDPWQQDSHLPFIDPETGILFMYSTGTKGGIGAIGSLFRAYVDHRTQDPESSSLPLCGLSSDGYQHRDYGPVATPLFEILDWQDLPSRFKAPAFTPYVPRLAKPRPAEVTHTKRPILLAKDIDDTIPF